MELGFDWLLDIDQYKQLTDRNDWAGICHLNVQVLADLGAKKELRVLHQFLQRHEIVFAFLSGTMSKTATSNEFEFDFGLNTWLAALTSQRVLFLDHSAKMFSTSVEAEVLTLNRIQEVSSSQGLLLGKVIIDIGDGMIEINNCINSDGKTFAELANELIRENEERNETDSAPNISIADGILKLTDLHAKGILTDDEYSVAKSKLIEKL